MDLEAHRSFLKSIAYRMTGTVGDADDVVQEAFARTIAHPPPDVSRPLRPWLVRVTMNVARDHLRRRRRRGHHGPWLPGAIDDSALDVGVDLGDSAEDRYGKKESVTFAFLIALEALSPVQRAVLVLREVFEFSGKETADALGLTEGNAKTVLSRAKKALRAYDVDRVIPDEHRLARDSDALQRFMLALATDDVDAALALLRNDVVGLTDGGMFRAARVPLVGADRLLQVLRSLMRKWPEGSFEVQAVIVNAQPALVMRSFAMEEGYGPLWMVRVDTDDDGLIRGVHALGATDKLVGLPSV